MPKSSSVPYANATSGTAARDEIIKILKRFGCSSIGFMDNFEQHSVLLYFEHRGNQVRLEASAKGWAAMYLRENPWTSRRALRREAYERDVLERGVVAINSVLRDWVKGQVTAVECGVMSFTAVFFAHMIASDGRPLLAHVAEAKLLPAPEAA